MQDMTGWTDEQLVEACLQGNEHAWSALVDKYKNLIFSIPIRMGLSRDDAGEIFQHVCLKLLSELEKIRDLNCLSGWLIKVTSYDCFRWVRRERMRNSVALESEAAAAAQAPALPDAELLELEREQIFRDTLMEISPRCQELIRMLFYQSPAVPYDEVAKSLKLARGSIGFMRMRCLSQLRAKLVERGFK